MSTDILSHQDAEQLIAVEKRLVLDPGEDIGIPNFGEKLQFQARSVDNLSRFQIDVNRTGKRKILKCTYQKRYQVSQILVRLDIDGPPHTNPMASADDVCRPEMHPYLGEYMECPHLHLYTAGFGDRFAMPMPSSSFSDASDLIQCLRDFLTYCNFTDHIDLQSGLQ